MKAKIMANVLKRLIAATKGFTAISEVRPVYQFIKLDFCKETNSVTAVAVDGYRISVEHATCLEIDEDFSAFIKSGIPRSTAKSVAFIEVKENVCFVQIGDSISGYKQPKDFFMDYEKSIGAMTNNPPTFRIGFNGNYLISALQAAQASCGNVFKQPVVLEFRGENDAIILRTNSNDIKAVLPMRLKTEAQS